ncbi:hypothetical protein LL912_12515 [Niabella sp. CC-SYL272]|uniref:hypothetical protein n=1 Tax=Niabella agricola TaxID=2891571 RepID=UPI001F18595C|nr:hypothetical protein [Niabella agricola]MCF3109596.1 hypothetical protein [Niabella agricola]
MINRVEKGISDWHARQNRYAGIFGAKALDGRAFAKIRLQEMRALQRQCQPPRNIDERVSLKMLRSANKNLERRIYPNRLYRVGRRFARWTLRQTGRVIKGIAAMMQDNPAAHLNNPSPPGKREPVKPTPVKVQQESKVVRHPMARRPRVIRMPPRVHPRLPEAPGRSRGVSR